MPRTSNIDPSPERFTVFLLSPVNLAGVRAGQLLNPAAAFATARDVQSTGGAPLDRVFSFVSGLYFRGKIAYADRFGRPPPGASGAWVISPGDGLVLPRERVTRDRLLAWASVPIDHGNPSFTRPLMRHAEALERAYGASTQFVLLGSVATQKYVGPLVRVFGDHLSFPVTFVGRGDMSRGALMLRSARDGVELAYAAVEGAVRHARRAPQGDRSTSAPAARRGRGPSVDPSLRDLRIGPPGSVPTPVRRARSRKA